ncbi:MAG: ParA family protein [Mycoplasmoidaceae bacterium]
MIISIVNNKGGVLKTTLATNIAAAFSLNKKKTLIIDLDGQGNVVATFGKNPYVIKKTVLSVLKEETKVDEAIIKEREFLHILPSNDELNYFDMYISKGMIKTDSLKKLIHALSSIYDYIIIDTPPMMSTIVSIVLSITNVVLIPFEPDQYAILGLRRIIDASLQIKQKVNNNLIIIAIPSKVNTRVTIHNEIIEKSIKPRLESQKIPITKNYISQSTKSTASVGYERVPITLSIYRSKFQLEYLELTREILEIIKREKNE